MNKSQIPISIHGLIFTAFLLLAGTDLVFRYYEPAHKRGKPGNLSQLRMKNPHDKEAYDV